jgi:phosphoribosylamine--glycine ligase
MNILILGGGGREHALAWAVMQNPKCDKLIVAPGNAGIAEIAECAALDIEDGGAVVAFCEENAIDFVIIGPEAPLAAGWPTGCAMPGCWSSAPRKAAARLEASKSFTKEICDACGRPPPPGRAFTDAAPPRPMSERQGAPIVVKADGLAAGKGVIVADDEDEACGRHRRHVRRRLRRRRRRGGDRGIHGPARRRAFFVLCDGETVLPIGTAQDHKRVGEGDTGPNTGGMGAYSPAPVLTTGGRQGAGRDRPPDRGRDGAARHALYRGALCRADDRGRRPRLVEYNVRFGDPECQVLMMRLGAQALDLMHACRRGAAGRDAQVNWADDHAMTVVMAAEGYPGSLRERQRDRRARGPARDSRHMVFHAGTGETDGQVDHCVPAGGC